MLLMRRSLSEFLATFILMFCGTGAVVANGFSGGSVTPMGISIVFGALVMAIIYAFGPISGAHINPAVTLAFAVTGSFAWKDVLPYIISQCLGAIAASLLLIALFPDDTTSLGATVPSIGIWQSFVLEVMLTFMLMLVILLLSTGAKETGIMAGLAIGMFVMLEALFAGSLTGASMNPARSLAPALVSGNVEHLWLYLAAPTSGALLAVAFWTALFKEKTPYVG
jgi:aquaporin Z